MKIAILGTKGIPNNYGGFEQFAEILSIQMVQNGHSVTVYNPSFHPYSKTDFKGVKIKTIYSPEKLIGAAANFIYDHLCLIHALKSDYDIIYEAGYHSVALSYMYFKIRKLKTPVIVTNMDGIEWKRSKWSGITRRLIKALEKIAVHESPYLISDNEGIRTYYKEKFNRNSFFIPYGAAMMEMPQSNYLLKFGLNPNAYFIVVARLEPENNIDVVLSGFLLSNSSLPIIIIGNHQTTYGQYLKKTFQSDKILFLGGIYDKSELDSLRHFSIAYFHGHSVGGTNPSLLEAMACRCFIIAHSNEFNKSVLQESALYFSNSTEIRNYIQTVQALRKEKYVFFDHSNIDKIENQYSWDIIVKQHEDLFKSLLPSTRM